MVPLTVHIVGYTPCTVPGYEQYPNLQVEGQMGGGDWKWHEDTRRIYGTVGVIADGSIRWSLVRCIVDCRSCRRSLTHSGTVFDRCRRPERERVDI